MKTGFFQVPIKYTRCITIKLCLMKISSIIMKVLLEIQK